MSNTTAIHYRIEWKGNPYAATLSSCFLTHLSGYHKSKWPKMTGKYSRSHKSKVSMLYKDAFGPKECGCHLPATGLFESVGRFWDYNYYFSLELLKG
ncbi:hypothetical protein Tco_0438177 [Tanacetum coccineum]